MPAFWDEAGRGEQAVNRGLALGWMSVLVLSALMLLIWTAPHVQAGCSGCQVTAGGWEQYDFLEADLTPSPPGDGQAGTYRAVASSPYLYRSGKFPAELLLASPASVSSSDLMLWVSIEKQDWYPQDAAGLPYTSLLHGSSLASPSEMAAALSGAGVNSNDSVVVASSDPGQAALVVWALKYLGGEKVALLDGGYESWKAAGLPQRRNLAQMNAGQFHPAPDPGLLVTTLPSGATLLDARPFSAASQDPLPGAVNVEARDMTNQGRIREREELERVFSRLDPRRQMVVTSPDPTQAALVWYGLMIMGFSASLMEWDNARQTAPD